MYLNINSIRIGIEYQFLHTKSRTKPNNSVPHLGVAHHFINFYIKRGDIFFSKDKIQLIDYQ